MIWQKQLEFKRLLNHTTNRLNSAVCQQFHRHRQFYTIQRRCRLNTVTMKDSLRRHITEQPEIQVKLVYYQKNILGNLKKINKNELNQFELFCSPIQCTIHAKWTKFAGGPSSRYVSKHDITISNERCDESATVQSAATVEQSEYRTHFINIEFTYVGNSKTNIANWSNRNKSECR